jgi:hypothetical protein
MQKATYTRDSEGRKGKREKRVASSPKAAFGRGRGWGRVKTQKRT